MFLIFLSLFHFDSMAYSEKVMIKFNQRQDVFVFDSSLYSLKSDKINISIERNDCIKPDLNNFKESFEQNFFPLPALKQTGGHDVIITYQNQTKVVRDSSFQGRWALGLRDDFIQLKLNSRLKCR